MNNPVSFGATLRLILLLHFQPAIVRRSLSSALIPSMRTKTGTQRFGENDVHCLSGLSHGEQNAPGL